MKKQPAKVSYFFEKGYADVANALRYSWEAALKPCKSEAARIRDVFSKHNFLLAIFLSIFDFVVFSFMTVIGVAVSIVISAILIILFAIMMSIIYILFMILKFIDYTFCVIYKISNKCPKCQKKFMHPIYICPNCGAKHDKLVPSKYGILKRTCNCGNKIPTSFLNGRQKLSAICPYCQSNDATKVESNSRDVCCIPVIGGRDSGKTCFISSSIVGLEKKFKAKGWNFEHLYGINDEYADNIDRINNGVCPLQTSDMRLKYYRFAVNKKQNDIRNIITLCDVGGEAYSQGASAQNITDQIGFRYADGLLMIIDPLSIPEYKAEVVSSCEVSKYRGSTKSIDDVLSIVVNTLDNMFKLSYKEKIKTNIAIVFTKCDIPGLDNLIGEAAVKRYQMSHPKVSKNEIRNKLCIEFLQKYGEQNFVNSLMSRFKEIQFFTSSALGHNANGQKFISKGVEEPVMWLIANSNSPITLE